jgi:hypothetical protein
MKTVPCLGLLSMLVFCLSFLMPPRSALAQEENSYTGSKSCFMCHSPARKLWDEHGHSKMLRPVMNGQAPQDAKVTPPQGKTWKDLSYLIGGYHVYGQFADAKGYVVTGPGAQWSLEGKVLTPYHADMAPGTMKYGDCIKCHVVGYRTTGAYEGGVQNSLEGIPGAWYENGVGCESCHGMGKLHMLLKDKAGVKKAGGDLKIEMKEASAHCGNCHKRNDDNSLNVVAKDLVESRQQYTELMLGRHGKFKLTCTTCHNPHTSYTNSSGFAKKCLDCHTGKFAKPVKLAPMKDFPCETCHMPLADRGAFDTMVKDYHKGDTHSHIFGITLDPAYTLDGGNGKANVDKDGNVRMTVEMVCFSCHKAGKSHDMNRETMLEMAKKVH